MDSRGWMRDRVLAERPESILDVGGDLAFRLGDLGNAKIIATGNPTEREVYDRVVTKGRWPKVDVVLLTAPAEDTAEVWDRARKSARKTMLALVDLGRGGPFADDGEVHRVLPGIVASDGHGLYAVAPLG